jgi:hypothetical protein
MCRSLAGSIANSPRWEKQHSPKMDMDRIAILVIFYQGDDEYGTDWGHRLWIPSPKQHKERASINEKSLLQPHQIRKLKGKLFGVVHLCPA